MIPSVNLPTCLQSFLLFLWLNMGHGKTDQSSSLSSQAEYALQVELCRYFAQALYANRDIFDAAHNSLPKITLPSDGRIAAETIILDGVSSPYERAASALVRFGFAVEMGRNTGRYILTVGSDEFGMPANYNTQADGMVPPACDFVPIFSIYELNQRLGHPDTLERIFELFLEAGYTEERFGFLEWSQRSVDMTSRGHMNQHRKPKEHRLWSTDCFGIYIEEAKAQWLGSDT